MKIENDDSKNQIVYLRKQLNIVFKNKEKMSTKITLFDKNVNTVSETETVHDHY